MLQLKPKGIDSDDPASWKTVSRLPYVFCSATFKNMKHVDALDVYSSTLKCTQTFTMLNLEMQPRSQLKAEPDTLQWVSPPSRWKNHPRYVSKLKMLIELYTLVSLMCQYWMNHSWHLGPQRFLTQRKALVTRFGWTANCPYASSQSWLNHTWLLKINNHLGS